MSTDRDPDDLARTATAHGDGSTPADPASQPAVGAMIGRYRLERELGVGGMGVVHVAFDPDLERRVALKVLRVAGNDAAKRLQREARAMARLTHPNVVTVHEVGSASGRDYVAMELVEGDTLADWLRKVRRDPKEIIDAFVAAGRGLAAAHAAGIVHRDFKPHNVLRSRAGRIAVTDFGLARETLPDGASDPLATTLPLPGSSTTSSSTSNTPSLLAGLTVSGSLLGTPAYMAPEQWNGGAVTPATDQFAFCVALWEALAGERPFRGPTLDDLRAQVADGAKALDASKIPRRLRPILVRGLDPVPAQRWPSMDALLAAIVRVERRPGVALGIAGVALAASGVLVFALRGGAAPEPACAAAILEPATVWNAGVVAALDKAGQGPAARELAADFALWQTMRAKACAAAPPVRAPMLSCLDGVLSRFDALARGTEKAPGGNPVDPGEHLIDPAICDQTPPPRLTPVWSPAMRDVAATLLREYAVPEPSDPAAVSALITRVSSDPCASAYARILEITTLRDDSKVKQVLALAHQDAGRCGDDRIAADIALLDAELAIGSDFLSPTVMAKVKAAEVASQRVVQADITASLALMKMQISMRAGNLDEAIAHGSAAVASYEARGRIAAQIGAGLAVVSLRQTRATPEDLGAISRLLAEWRTLATSRLGAEHRILRSVASQEARWALSNGDVAGARAQLEALRRPYPIEGARPLRGRVVDEQGTPVAGATVVAGPAISGDAISVELPVSSYSQTRSTTTAADGTFVLPEAAPEGVVIAQLGDRRSSALAIAEGVELRLAPTSRIRGRVDLKGVPSSRVGIIVLDADQPVTLSYNLIAPVRADGTFVIEGAPRGKVKVMVALGDGASASMSSTTVNVTGPELTGVALAVSSSKRIVHVLVRSTVGIAQERARVVVLPGEVTSTDALTFNQNVSGAMSLRAARPLHGESHPTELLAAARSGDMFATFDQAPEGIASACAIGLPAETLDEADNKKLEANLDKVEVRCVPIPADAKVVVVEVPPWPRFD